MRFVAKGPRRPLDYLSFGVVILTIWIIIDFGAKMTFGWLAVAALPFNLHFALRLIFPEEEENQVSVKN